MAAAGLRETGMRKKWDKHKNDALLLLSSFLAGTPRAFVRLAPLLPAVLEACLPPNVG